MDEFDNVKLISLFESQAAGLSPSRPSGNKFTVTFNTLTPSHLHGKAARLLKHYWDRMLGRVLYTWKDRCNTGQRFSILSPSSPGKIFRPLKKPVLKPELDEPTNVWRVSMNKEGSPQIRASAMRKLMQLFKTSFKAVFYKWKFEKKSVRSGVTRVKKVAHVLSTLVLKTQRVGFQSLWRMLYTSNTPRSTVELPTPVSGNLDNAFEIPSFEKVSFELGESYDIEAVDEVYQLFDTYTPKHPHHMDTHHKAMTPNSVNKRTFDNRSTLLLNITRRGELRWFFAKKHYLKFIQQRIRKLPPNSHRFQQAVKLQAIIRGFLVRIHLQLKKKIQPLFKAKEMYLLVIASKRNFYSTLSKWKSEGVHARLAYALKFKNLLRRASSGKKQFFASGTRTSI